MSCNEGRIIISLSRVSITRYVGWGRRQSLSKFEEMNANSSWQQGEAAWDAWNLPGSCLEATRDLDGDTTNAV